MNLLGGLTSRQPGQIAQVLIGAPAINQKITYFKLLLDQPVQPFISLDLGLGAKMAAVGDVELVGLATEEVVGGGKVDKNTTK